MSRRMIRWIDVAAALLLALGIGVFAHGSTPPAADGDPMAGEPAPEAEAGVGEDDAAASGVLSGPGVGKAGRKSIVSRTFEGTLERLDVWPEEAAVELLALSEESRRAINDILAERAAVIDRVVSENLDALVKLANDGEGGRWFGALTHLRAFQKKIESQLEDTRPLVERFAEALPREQAEELERMVEEYWEALAADEVGGEIEKFGGRVKAALAKKTDSLRLMGEELGRAYQRIEKSAAVYAEYFINELGFTGANADAVREVVREFLSTVDDPEELMEEEWVPAIRALYKKLDEQGRAVLFEFVLGQG